MKKICLNHGLDEKNYSPAFQFVCSSFVLLFETKNFHLNYKK